MSNPSGRDQDAKKAREESEPTDEPTEEFGTGEPAPLFESAAPTEVLPGRERPADDPNQRRYSAPSGFDVKSTQIIRTPVGAETRVVETQPSRTLPAVVKGTAAPTTGNAPRTATPQAIPPREKHRSWGLVAILVLVIVVLVAVVLFAIMWFRNRDTPSASQEDQVRQTIQEFDVAIQKGDLAELRKITCGSTGDAYNNYPDAQWATNQARVAATRQYPVLASIDGVVVGSDQQAKADVTTFQAYAPQVRSTRGFDLQYVNGSWKICRGPIT